MPILFLRQALGVRSESHCETILIPVMSECEITDTEIIKWIMNAFLLMSECEITDIHMYVAVDSVPYQIVTLYIAGIKSMLSFRKYIS